jgi:hypothetical protein
MEEHDYFDNRACGEAIEGGVEMSLFITKR